MDITDIDLDSRGEAIPEKHDKRIVIDADTIAFAACVICEEKIETLGPDFMSPEEYEVMRVIPSWDDEEYCYYQIDIDEAMDHAQSKIQLILDRVGGKVENMELHFTGGKDNFRYTLLKEAFPDDPTKGYKAKRGKNKAPEGLFMLKQKLLVHYQGDIHFEYEADDAVVYRKDSLGDKCIMCAVDKDVLDNTPGRHFNYFEASHYKEPKEMKWVEYTKEEAMYHQYLQVIIGDKSDNVPGLHGVGIKKAEKFLDPGMTEQELWDGVITAYVRHCDYGDPEEMAILNMRLVNMRQLNEKGEIELWHPEMIK